jgi:hypothetical protein
MVYEKFDCSLLHEKELEEISMTIYSAFWSQKLENKAYIIDPLLKEDAFSEKNIGYATIPISNLKTKTINKDFKEPIKIKIEDKVVKFRLHRIKDMLEAKEYVEKKYFSQERELSDIKAALMKKEKTISYENQKKYEDYENNKAMDILKVLQASVILEIEDKVEGQQLQTIDQKLEAYKNLDTKYWQEYQKVVDTIEFGIDPEVKFFSIEKKEDLTRRFSFQLLDFIPTLDLQRDTKVIVSFGD